MSSPFYQDHTAKAKEALDAQPKPKTIVRQGKNVNAFELDEMERELRDALDAFRRGNNLDAKAAVQRAMDRLEDIQR